MVKLILFKRIAIPDIEKEVSYLITIVSKSNEYEWKKLRRVLVWIKIIFMINIIGALILKHVYTWVGAEYAVHPNMRIHTGGEMSFGTGLVHSELSK